MNIHEYQAKTLLKQYGIPVPKGFVAGTLEEVEKAGWSIETDKAVVKAQIHARGRGKAGGVKMVSNLADLKTEAAHLLGKTLVTHQTGPEGRVVKKLLIEESCEIWKEYYIAITLDPEAARVMIIASEQDDAHIKSFAAENPDRIHKEIIDPVTGLAEFQAHRICHGIQIPPEQLRDTVDLMKNLYRCFIEQDGSMAEINPLVISKSGEVQALDAKLSFDDNALFRQPHLRKYLDLNEEEEKEVEAASHGLAYASLEGNIGCMVNGAGLAMATMDIIKHYGGHPGNFLDIGSGATEETVKAAFKILMSDSKVSGILVNIFGGIIKCDVIAKGLLNAVKDIELQVPIVLRLEGTNVEEGLKILKSSNLEIVTVANMSEGAQKIVELVEGKRGAA